MLERIEEKLMGGNPKRFLRKHRNQYHYPLGFTKLLPQLDTKEYTYVLSIFPHQSSKTNHVLNIMETAHKHFGAKKNLKNLKLITENYEDIADTIGDYMSEHRSKHGANLSREITTRRRALKEQIARGFIKKSKWKYYDENFAHVESIANVDYIYPMNLTRIAGEVPRKFKRKYYFDQYANIFNHHNGVPGWTRIIVPF